MYSFHLNFCCLCDFSIFYRVLGVNTTIKVAFDCVNFIYLISKLIYKKRQTDKKIVSRLLKKFLFF